MDIYYLILSIDSLNYLNRYFCVCAEFAVFLATNYALAKGLITELELTKHFGSHSARFPSLSGQKWQGPQLVAEYHLSALVLFSSRKIPPF